MFKQQKKSFYTRLMIPVTKSHQGSSGCEFLVTMETLRLVFGHRQEISQTCRGYFFLDVQAGSEPLTRLWAHMGGGCVDHGALGSGGNHLDGHIVSRLGAFWKICHSRTHWRQTRDVRICFPGKKDPYNLLGI